MFLHQKLNTFHFWNVLKNLKITEISTTKDVIIQLKKRDLLRNRLFKTFYDQYLTKHQEYNDKKINTRKIRIGDSVLIRDDSLSTRNRYPIGTVIDLKLSVTDGRARTLRIRIPASSTTKEKIIVRDRKMIYLSEITNEDDVTFWRIFMFNKTFSNIFKKIPS